MDETDPAAVYGPLPPDEELARRRRDSMPELCPGEGSGHATPAEIEAHRRARDGIRDLHVLKSEFKPVPPKRILTITLQVEATEVHAGLQLSQQICYNSLASPVQVDAIVEALTELDYRLSLALGTLRVTPDL